MPLAVICFCGYMCNYSLSWRDQDFDSYKWVQALKGKKLNKYAHVPVRGVSTYFAEGNKDDAARWFGMFVADYLKKRRIAGPFLVVPVPNSDCTSTSSRPRTRRLAKAVCDELNDGSVLLDCLRFKEDLGSASQEGGPRDAKTLYENLSVLKDQLKEVKKGSRVLLVDDVTTSGGHLRACAARLTVVARLNVQSIFCGGKTVYDQDNRAFHTYEYTLDEYEP